MNVVVIGGGVVGLCAADELLQRGHRVTVVDRTGATEGCSYGNGGIVVPSHFVPLASPGMVRIGLKMMLRRDTPFGLAGLPDLATLAWMGRFLKNANKSQVEANSPILKELNLRSRTAYEALLSRLRISVGYAQRGLLMLCNTEKALEEEIALGETAGKLGLRTVPLSNEEVAKLEPELDLNVQGGVHFLDDAHLTPPAFMNALRESLEQRGVSFVCSEVKGLYRSQRRLGAVELQAGSLGADQFVLAAGAWSGELGKAIGLNLPMLSGKGYGLTVKNPPQPLNTPCIFTEARIAITPMLDGIRFVGTLELGHPKDGITQSRVEGMYKGIEQYFPAFTRERVAASPVWFGHRPCTPDGMPYIGRTRRIDNVVVATGHAMMGMSLGPITGRLVGTLVDCEPTELPIDRLSPDRYD